MLATATGFVADFGASGVQSDDAAKLTPAQQALLWKLVTTHDDRQISAILRAFLSSDRTH